MFISHASENKNDLAKPLANRLIQLGIKVWYDEFSLKLGDSLRESIDKGIVNSAYGLIIISKEFIEKKWTNWELNGFINLLMSNKTNLIPVWYKVTKDDIVSWSPSVADLIAIVANNVDDIVDGIEQKTDISTYLGYKFLRNENIPILQRIRISDSVKILLFGKKSLPHAVFRVDNDKLFDVDRYVTEIDELDYFIFQKDNKLIIESLIAGFNTNKYIFSDANIKECFLTEKGKSIYTKLLILPIIQISGFNMESERVLSQVFVIPLDDKEELSLNIEEERFVCLIEIISEAYNSVFPFFDTRVKNLYSV